MEHFDYVIVGAGSAGCVLANRLSEGGKYDVLVLEAGPSDWHPYIHIPAGFIKTFYDKRVNWMYDQEPGPWTGGRRIMAPRGKTLGGSSSINGHVFNRGQRMDFDTWAQRGNHGWGYSDVLPYFRRLERRIGTADTTFRGRDGAITVTNPNWSHPLCDAFIAGAVQMGIPHTTDYNGETQEGVSYAQRTINRGWRVSSSTAYLWPARKRQNLTIRTMAHATEIMLQGKRAVGVRYAKGGRGGPIVEVRADKEVILAGGTYNSPQLLQLSGIGPADLLADKGIAVKHALAGVGENLSDHYTARFVARVKGIETINERVRGLKLGAEILKWMTTGGGVLSQSPTTVYCFWRSEPTVPTSDVQITFTPASYKEGVQGQLETEPGMSVASWAQRPGSRGFVRIRSNDPFASPAIQTNYLAEESDRRTTLGAMRLARRLLHSEPLKPYIVREEVPGAEVQSDDELLAVIRNRGLTTFHPAGTCMMGPATNPRAVVDHELRVHGLQGLRVVDASIMPTMISANLNASTLMIGEKASDMILGRPPEPATALAG